MHMLADRSRNSIFLLVWIFFPLLSQASNGVSFLFEFSFSFAPTKQRRKGEKGIGKRFSLSGR